MKQLRVTIPDGVEFEDLHLSRDVGDGRVHFSMAPIEAICEASALDLNEIVKGPQPLVVLLIAAWYRAHVEQGGALDPVQEDLMEEMRLEEAHGGGFTYPPGHELGTLPGRGASWPDQPVEQVRARPCLGASAVEFRGAQPRPVGGSAGWLSSSANSVDSRTASLQSHSASTRRSASTDDSPRFSTFGSFTTRPCWKTDFNSDISLSPRMR